MIIKSVDDLKAMDPALLKKLGLRKITANDIAKLGLRVFNSGDVAKINTKPFDINDLAQYGLKNFYTTESAEHWLNNLTSSKSQPKQNSTQPNDNPVNFTTDTSNNSVNSQQTANKAGISKEALGIEQSNVIKKRPYPRRGWPFLWGRPAFGRTRKNHYSTGSKQEEQKEKLPKDSDLPGNHLEDALQQTSEMGQKISSMNLPVGKKKGENKVMDSEISAINLDELQKVKTNSKDAFEDNLVNNSEGNFETVFDHPPVDNNDDISNKETENMERIFQLESVKEGIEIQRNPYKVMTKNLCHICKTDNY